MNVGEEIAAEYLKWVSGCDFVELNLKIPEIHGEIDVVGINLELKQIFVCEVAIHLETGLQYTKDNRPNNVPKLSEKFDKDIQYARKFFPDYELVAMLWTPIVKDQGARSKYNQLNDIREIQQFVRQKHDVELLAVINQEFARRLNELRTVAKSKTEALTSPVMRLFQIEAKLSSHIKRLNKNSEKQ